jgi:hypothetical protein
VTLIIKESLEVDPADIHVTVAPSSAEWAVVVSIALRGEYEVHAA